MNLPFNPETTPFLSVLIFGPLAAAVVAALLRSDRALHWWTLVFTLASCARGPRTSKVPRCLGRRCPTTSAPST